MTKKLDFGPTGVLGRQYGDGNERGGNDNEVIDIVIDVPGDDAYAYFNITLTILGTPVPLCLPIDIPKSSLLKMLEARQDFIASGQIDD